MSERAGKIASDLKAHGMRVVDAGLTDDGNDIAVMFELTGNDTTPWHKVVLCDAAAGDAAAVVMLWNAWTAEKRREIAINLPSETVGRAIRTYGIVAVKNALRPIRRLK